jgi:hypothetical protein
MESVGGGHASMRCDFTAIADSGGVEIVGMWVIGVIGPYMLQRGGEQALVAWKLGDADGVMRKRQHMRLPFWEWQKERRRKKTIADVDSVHI